MINPRWLELPLSRTNFHGPKDVRAIEVGLYINICSCENCSFGLKKRVQNSLSIRATRVRTIEVRPYTHLCLLVAHSVPLFGRVFLK